MGGNDDADVHLDGLIATDTFDFALFEDPQELGLHGQRHIPDLVEEKRATFGLFEFTGVARGGTGERAFFVAEKFRLDELGGNGSAIQRNECIFAARRFLVDGASDEFFAGAGFAEDADAGFAGRDAINLRQKFAHRSAGADKLVFAQTVAKFAILIFEAREFQSVIDGEEKLVGGKGLFEKIQSAEACRFDGHFDIGLTGDENDRSLQAGLLEFFEEFHAGFTGHDHVGKNQVEALRIAEVPWRGWRYRRRWPHDRQGGRRATGRRECWGRRR